jgi:thioredoxin reductase (NADPH)
VFYVPAEAGRHGICVQAAAVDVRLVPSGVEIVFQGQSRLLVDTIYPCLGCAPQTALAGAVGAAVSDNGGLLVDKHQRTNVKGLYGAGDVLQGLDQIASVFGHAAIAATAIHNDLTGSA